MITRRYVGMQRDQNDVTMRNTTPGKVARPSYIEHGSITEGSKHSLETKQKREEDTISSARIRQDHGDDLRFGECVSMLCCRAEVNVVPGTQEGDKLYWIRVY